MIPLAMWCACSPGTTPSDGGAGGGGAGGGSGTASMCTFTGGKMGSVPCSFQSAQWVSAGNRTTIKVGTAMGASTTVTAQFVVTSKPMAVNYSGGMADTECTIVLNDGTKTWTSDTTMALGACALNIRSVRAEAMDTFDLHGGFSASLQPDDGTGGDVTMQSSF